MSYVLRTSISSLYVIRETNLVRQNIFGWWFDEDDIRSIPIETIDRSNFVAGVLLLSLSARVGKRVYEADGDGRMLVTGKVSRPYRWIL